ncbi:Rhodanese domain protein [Alkaliphilus metalliredigens QYMF]|uniref:Rhodanese domain protein n=1 Tax=Alkaliphilus metalliredigens (strain QYMF) TaxID=293826 RepID=A6TTA3_ALKMQ|nr:rhodanese-like domain-containing protein [Alkaliphilus metalliredigens]ABR49421.1 Rhodanese domain protein [Alkaliphilus metalliredigens QYMF]
MEAFGATVPVNKNYIIDLPEAKEILADQERSKLVDIRSWEEYIGTTSGYSYIEGKGRPAGAAWGHDLNNYRNIDNTMKNAAEIKSMWNEWGISPDQRLSFFCGTGWRAAEVLIYAEVMGLENISLFDGGWNEWQDDASNPIELGESN